MIDLILQDSQQHPSVFFWWGPLSASAIEDWERTHALCVPKDLKQLWSLKGGATSSSRNRYSSPLAQTRTT